MTFLRACLVLPAFLLIPPAYPPLGIIDSFGIRTISEAQVRQALGFHEGDAIDWQQFEQSRDEAIEKI
jgi:hypothetical protein